MAAGGGGVDGSVGGDAGIEFYRVLLTGIPPVPNQELSVRDKLRGLLPGEIVDVKTQGTANAVVTLRCKQGFSCSVKTKQDIHSGGCAMTLYNLGTFHATLTMGNAPSEVVQEFFQRAGGHGVVFQATDNNCFTLTGLIDSINNLRAEVDARLLQTVQPNVPQQPTASSSPQPVVGADHVRDLAASSGAPVAPPPGIPTHVFSRSSSDPSTLGHNPPTSSGTRFDSTGPLSPLALGPSSAATYPGHPATSHRTGPITTGGTSGPTSLPGTGSPTTAPGTGPASLHRSTSGGHLPSSDSFSTSHLLEDDLPGPVVHYKPDDHSGGHDSSTDRTPRGAGPSASVDKAVGLDTTHTGTKSPTSPPPSDVSTEERPNVFTNLNPDALALVQRLPEGDIPGIEYHVKEGSVHIQLEGESKVEAAITKFQETYKKVVAPGRRLRAEDVEIPLACSKERVKAEITEFEQKYLSTAFVLDEEKGVIRVISQARQFDQAKMFLEKALQQPSTGSAAASDAVADSMAMRFSENRTLTLKKGDIAKEKADILVNAANGSLIHGSGVAGALNAASERKLQIHCNKYMEGRSFKSIPVGDVAVTKAGGRLACKHVIHAVGPDGSMHSSVQCERLVKQAISNTLKAAERYSATSIVLPAISCGIFDVSKDLVARCIIDTILGFNYSKPHPCLSDIRIVILDGSTFSCFAQYLEQKAQPHRKGPGKISVHSHKVDPQKVSKNTDENTVALEGIKLSLDDMDWIMPLLRRAAPKWKKILMKIGIQNEAIVQMTNSSQDERVLLTMGVNRWLRQKQTEVTLAALVAALSSPDIGERDIAAEIVTAALGKAKGSPSGVSDVKYPEFHNSTEGGCTSIAKSGKETESGSRTDVDKPTSPKDKKCPICWEEFKSPVKTKCDHMFCKGCIHKALEYDPYCPTCRTPLRAITGKQPAGATMTHYVLDGSVPGYEGFKTIQINYNIPSGIQGPEHPNPGHPYHGTSRTAYLPYCREGWIVFKLLEKAFQARMIFTIGTSVTTGAQNVVVWNDIHHKTNIYGGPQNYGYPDPTYLQRVTEDLAAKGIVPD